MLGLKGFNSLYNIYLRSTFNLQKSNSILNISKQYGNHETDQLIIFLNTICLNFSKQKKAIYDEHDIDNKYRFNIFESISDKWYRENFHSDILYTILNPKTKEIGNKENLKKFVAFLGLSPQQFDCSKDFEVFKEHPTGEILWTDNNGTSRIMKGFIDLLIKNDKQAIIIENKINYAPDMENQLVRYMKYVEEKLNIQNYTVVYLTLVNDKNKKPPINSYDFDFQKYIDKLKDNQVLKEVYAVDNNNSLCTNFLQCCLNENDTIIYNNIYNPNSISSFYINQYKILLEHLGGEAFMMSTFKKLVNEIYSDKEKLEAAIDFAEFWNNTKNLKNEAIKEVLQEKFVHKFPSKKLKLDKINNAEEYFWETNSKNCLIYWNGMYEMGFASLQDKQFTEDEKNKLSEIIMNIPNRLNEDVTDNWVYFNLKDNLLLDEIINTLSSLFDSQS